MLPRSPALARPRAWVLVLPPTRKAAPPDEKPRAGRRYRDWSVPRTPPTARAGPRAGRPPPLAAPPSLSFPYPSGPTTPVTEVRNHLGREPALQTRDSRLLSGPSRALCHRTRLANGSRAASAPPSRRRRRESGQRARPDQSTDAERCSRPMKSQERTKPLPPKAPLPLRTAIRPPGRPDPRFPEACLFAEGWPTMPPGPAVRLSVSLRVRGPRSALPFRTVPTSTLAPGPTAAARRVPAESKPQSRCRPNRRRLKHPDGPRRPGC